jgi:hypothetical protein
MNNTGLRKVLRSSIVRRKTLEDVAGRMTRRGESRLNNTISCSPGIGWKWFGNGFSHFCDRSRRELGAVHNARPSLRAFFASLVVLVVELVCRCRYRK